MSDAKTHYQTVKALNGSDSALRAACDEIDQLRNRNAELEKELCAYKFGSANVNLSYAEKYDREKKRADELEAQCAATRAVLILLEADAEVEFAQTTDPARKLTLHKTQEKIAKALSSTTGADLLARLRKAEDLLKEATITIRDYRHNGPYLLEGVLYALETKIINWLKGGKA